jgi:hypothetical protein
MVEVALRSAEATLRTWGLEQRTSRLAPDDPTARQALANAWLDNPTLRAAVLASKACRARLLPWLRGRLGAGALRLPEATATLHTIGRLYGGVEPLDWEARRVPSELEAADRRARARAEAGVWLDPCGGPPTANEWTALRDLTRHTLATGARAGWDVLSVLPPGPWTPDDLAVLEALEQRLLERLAFDGAAPGSAADPAADGSASDPRRALALVGPLVHRYSEILETKPPSDVAARAQRILAAWDLPRAGRRAATFHTLRRLAAGGDAQAPAAATPDWMDEDDEEPDR